MKTTDQACQHQTISATALGKVTLCAHCAVVHVDVGHATLRFTLDAFRDLGALLRQAQMSLDAGARPAPAPFVMPPVGRIQ